MTVARVETTVLEEFFTSGEDAVHAVPEEKREELVSELMDAARQIALQNMPRKSVFSFSKVIVFDQHCRECGQASRERNIVPHLASCNTGRVLALTAELKELRSNPTGAGIHLDGVYVSAEQLKEMRQEPVYYLARSG